MGVQGFHVPRKVPNGSSDNRRLLPSLLQARSRRTRPAPASPGTDQGTRRPLRRGRGGPVHGDACPRMSACPAEAWSGGVQPRATVGTRAAAKPAGAARARQKTGPSTRVGRRSHGAQRHRARACSAAPGVAGPASALSPAPAPQLDPPSHGQPCPQHRRGGQKLRDPLATARPPRTAQPTQARTVWRPRGLEAVRGYSKGASPGGSAPSPGCVPTFPRALSAVRGGVPCPTAGDPGRHVRVSACTHSGCVPRVSPAPSRRTSAWV